MSRRFGHRSGDRLRTETALNFTDSSDIAAFPNSQRKEQQQVFSSTPVLPQCAGIPQNIHLGAVAASGCHLSARTRSPGSEAGTKGLCASRWLSHHRGLNLPLLQLSFHEQTSIPPISLKVKNTGAFLFLLFGVYFWGWGLGSFPEHYLQRANQL